MSRKRKSYIIIDGYNIINAWEELKDISQGDLEHSREKLIDYAIEYSQFKGLIPIVVFDAYNTKTKETILKTYFLTVLAKFKRLDYKRIF
jgi:predicted RNA-binding protein with PIN domain